MSTARESTPDPGRAAVRPAVAAETAAQSYAAPAPASWQSNVHARRTYFSNLVPVLLLKGMDPRVIGESVAELDDHLAMTGADPVEELGPAGELAGRLVASAEGRRGHRVLVALLLGGMASGAVMGVVLSGGPWPGEDDVVTVSLVMALLWAGFWCARPILIWAGSGGVVGRRPREWRPRWWQHAIMFPAVVVAGVLFSGAGVELGLTSRVVLAVEIPTVAAFVVVGAALAIMATVGIALWRWTRVAVPGEPLHLRKLGRELVVG